MGEESFSELEVQEAVADSSPRRQGRRSRPWLLPLLLGTGLGVGVAFGGMRVLSNRPTPKAPVATNPSGQNINPSMTVTVARAETTRVARTLNATGTIAAQDLTPVLPQTNGLQIKEIKVDVGEQVKAGQVMAVLDDSVLQDQIRQAKADVEAKQADVASRQADLAAKQAAVASSQATVAANQAIVQQRQADLGQEKAKLEDFQRTYQRNQELAASGAISRQQLDTAATNLATAREAVRLAQANIRSAEANVKSAEANINSAQSTVKIAQANINSAQASVKSSAAKVKQLQTQLGQTFVKAPVAGVVAEKLARVGDITGVAPQSQVGTVIGGSQKLFSIISNGKLELQALIPEVQLSQVRVGAPVQITSDADKRVGLQGRVREIEPVINETSRKATVKIDLPTTSLLKPGMFARAAITTNTTIGVAAPQKAVRPQPDGSAIVFMLLGEDKVRAQKVEIGEILNNNRMEIKRGLQAGDRIVIDGAGYIKDGDKVKVVNVSR